MRIKKRKSLNLNDGYIGIYSVLEKSSGFAADITPKSMKDIEYVTELAFKELSKRDEDYSFAESEGRTLNMKVRTHLLKTVTKAHKVVYEQTIYNILKIDYEKQENVMYLYLEEGRPLANED